MVRMNSPIEYIPPHGGRSAFGFEATLLPANILKKVLDLCFICDYSEDIGQSSPPTRR